MSQSLNRMNELMPSVFDDFFKPWNEWFDGGMHARMLQVPAVNIAEEKDRYLVELAAPGMNKEDFSVNVEGNRLTISAQKEDRKEDAEKKYSRKEYSYTSFSRSFSIPPAVDKAKIEARYTDGVLKLTLPKVEEAKKDNTQRVAVH